MDGFTFRMQAGFLDNKVILLPVREKLTEMISHMSWFIVVKCLCKKKITR
jgi:hypothetical protein